MHTVQGVQELVLSVRGAFGDRLALLFPIGRCGRWAVFGAELGSFTAPTRAPRRLSFSMPRPVPIHRMQLESDLC